MSKPIRPKDVARLYMHRFKYYIPNIHGYQCAARAVGNSSRNIGVIDQYNSRYNSLSINVYYDHCMTAIEMRAFNIREYHALPEEDIVLMGELDLLTQIMQRPDWEHNVLMTCPVIQIPGSLLGAYCFDTFVIDNRLGDNGNVLYAKHQFSPRWSALTDLDALSEQ